MKEPVLQAEFVCSVTLDSPFDGPPRPEFALVGRSNVGKSSLINMLTGRRQLAHVSGTPGKTQTINYYLVNGRWYLVDLPGYGYARRSKTEKRTFGNLVRHYLLHSSQLYCVFVLIDSRLPPQTIDLDFISWLGKHEIPLALVLTKTDKLTAAELDRSRKQLEVELYKSWDTLPPLFVTSAHLKTGRKELLAFIDGTLANS
jgi:GTP-binding protein